MRNPFYVGRHRSPEIVLCTCGLGDAHESAVNHTNDCGKNKDATRRLHLGQGGQGSSPECHEQLLSCAP